MPRRPENYVLVRDVDGLLLLPCDAAGAQWTLSTRDAHVYPGHEAAQRAQRPFGWVAVVLPAAFAHAHLRTGSVAPRRVDCRGTYVLAADQAGHLCYAADHQAATWTADAAAAHPFPTLAHARHARIKHPGAIIAPRWFAGAHFTDAPARLTPEACEEVADHLPVLLRRRVHFPGLGRDAGLIPA